MKTLFVLVSVLFLASCAMTGKEKVFDGGAAYHYVKTPEGKCQIDVTSARNVPNGNILIGKDCDVQVKPTPMTNSGVSREVVDKLIDKIPGGE